MCVSVCLWEREREREKGRAYLQSSGLSERSSRNLFCGRMRAKQQSLLPPAGSLSKNLKTQEFLFPLQLSHCWFEVQPPGQEATLHRSKPAGFPSWSAQSTFLSTAWTRSMQDMGAIYFCLCHVEWFLVRRCAVNILWEKMLNALDGQANTPIMFNTYHALYCLVLQG